MARTAATTDATRIRVKLTGIAPIMFDRYAGDNKTQLEPEQKFYLDADGESLVIPAANISSMLTAQNTQSAPKRFLDSREYKKTAQAILSYTAIEPMSIPLTRNGKPIKVGRFVNDRDEKNGLWIHRCVARLDKGIPNPKVRPVVELPWEAAFTLTLFPNQEVGEEMILSLMRKSGIAIGLGTFRGVFGKFSVSEWTAAQ